MRSMYVLYGFGGVIFQLCMSPAHDEQYLGPSTEGPFIFVCLVVSVRFQYIWRRAHLFVVYVQIGGWVGVINGPSLIPKIFIFDKKVFIISW